MKKHLLIGSLAMFAGSLLAADTSSTNAAPDSTSQEVVAAAKALGEKSNYSWRTTVVVPEGARFRPGPTEGQTEKDGTTHIAMTMRDSTTEIVLQGGKSVVYTADNGWQLPSEMDTEGPGRFIGGMIRNFKTPAAQAADLAATAKELRKQDDTWSGDLTEEEAKKLLTFRGNASATDAKGSVTFRVKDGVLTKFEYKVSGKVTFNDNEQKVERDTTVEIKDVGTTKVKVPEEAKKKLS